MSGPFSGYTPPGVYTSTQLENAVALLGNTRIPALIGTSEEIKKLDGYEMIRGSSPIKDNKKVAEDVSAQFVVAGTRTFQVQNYPIVVGDGLGKITNNTNDVQVFVNGIQVIVAKVTGLSGTVTVAISPKTSDVVTVTYFYKKTDTKIIDESLSDQVDGLNTSFYTHFKPIVDGSNAGKPTTNVGNIIVKDNGSIVDVAHLDGVEGFFTLTVPPASGHTLTVTYYFNQYANTADDLPVPGLTQVIRVGVSPETSDFIESIDYAIIGDQIQWGTGYKLVSLIHTTGSDFFMEDKITGSLVDDKIYNEDVSSQFTGSEKSLVVKYLPIVDGTGRDIVTSDPHNVIVTVDGIVVSVNRIDGEIGKVYLQNAPSMGSEVLITYWRSRMQDDNYSIEVLTSGAVNVGTYKITSAENGRLGIAVLGAENVANGSFTGASYISGPTVAKGYTIDETVTLTFTSNTDFSVSSSEINGSTGFGKTDSTYVDSNTGLIFTLASDAFYASGDTLQIDVTAQAIFTCSTIPTTSIPGMYLIVNNTLDVTSGDITDLYAFDKSGKEPNVGDYYYISYMYEKQNYDCALFTKFKDVTSEFGDLKASNPLVLAAYLTFLNGASAVILCQVKKATNSDLASDTAYYDVLTRLQQDVNGINPSVILPITTSLAVINAVSQHCAIQSSMRNRRERISFFGFAVGTEPTEAANIALGINSERMIGVYPDGIVVELVDPDGTVVSNVVDGSFIAAAFCGLNVSNAYDVATPMTRKTLVGITNLVRSLDEVTMDMVASRGVTLIQKISSSFVIRHGLTTNMSSILTKEIMIITIKDFIQQQARQVLDSYIGRKMTGNLTNEISTSLGSMLRSATDAQIIKDYKGVTAEIDSVQPDYIKVSAFYVPIFGLNYIQVTFTVRTRF
jgi:hypothetical protein